ncbi:Protein bunched, class 2/F/G isoform [Frankliniella fusca]|uniref:Protein bunched, class 2/F/G isoform n=1 Tax=Frankliniella fusca TaxID=407009 RepID=A0AAE1HHU2_9NEOP|nr:Protein bunched, class 2/F/G isoform [Frankliniella fusca]
MQGMAGPHECDKDGGEVGRPAYGVFASVCCSASGASAVAIDNKIEQAMVSTVLSRLCSAVACVSSRGSLTDAGGLLQDLVKSHLMFAVREEVEVLKDKIAELMDRINQLEIENSILKANATQETLEQLLLAPKACDAAAPQQNGVATLQGAQQNGSATP